METHTADHPERLDRPFGEDILCPRCGYDLRGAVHSWRESCPMQGRCAECGLDFEWSSIFIREEHPWLIEYHWQRRRLSSAWHTSVRLFRPGRFWSAVRLEHPVQLLPAAALAMCLVALPILLRLAGGTAITAAESQRGARPFTTGRFLRVLEEAILGNSGWNWSGIDRMVAFPLPPAYLFILCWMPVTAVCFNLIPISLRRARVRPTHVRRIAFYGMAWMTLPLLAVSMVEFLVHVTNSLTLLAVFEYAVQPLSWEFPLALGPIPTAPLVFAPFAWWWWDCACRSYLKLPDGRLVAALLTLLSGLMTLGGFVLLAELLGEHSWWVDNL